MSLTSHHHWMRPALTSILALALLAGACGRDATPSGAEATPTPPPATEPSSEPTEPAPEETARLAAIVVEAPAEGQRVSSPVRIAGNADVFEATVSIRLRDAAGQELVRTFTTATCGSGCRGDYSKRVRFEVEREQDGVIEVFEESAEDGSEINVVRIPVTLVP